MRVHQKYGFGMAPVKPGTQERRDAAVGAVLGVRKSAGSPDSSVAEQRIKEINSHTRIIEPYGVCAVWTVRGAPQVEKAVHDALAEYRVRPDREFFELSYRTASKTITGIVRDSCREL